MKISLWRFVCVSVLLVGSTMLITSGDGFESMQHATAVGAAWLAGLFGAETTVVGSRVVTSGGVLRVIDTCLPLGITSVFVALVLATRTSNRRKAIGVAAGLSIVMAANLVRVGIAIIAAQADSAAFEYLHKGLLQMLPEALLFIPWMAWSGEEHRKEALRFAGVTLTLAVGASFAWPVLHSSYLSIIKTLPAPFSSAASGALPVGASPWVVAGVAVIAAARARVGRKTVAVLLLLGSLILADVALTFVASVSPLGAFEETTARSWLTFMAPVVAVLLFANGTPSSLWRPVAGPAEQPAAGLLPADQSST